MSILRSRLLSFLLFAAVLCVSSSIGCAFADAAKEQRSPEWAQPVTLDKSDNFFRVAPCLYRSAQPDAKGMEAYEAMGIRTVINLRANHSDDTEAQRTSLILRRIPINTWNIKDEHVVAVLSLLRTEEKPVLVHCQHGADRTGLMMAMYRIVEEGWSKEAALDELKNGGYGYHSIWTNIPKYIERVDVGKIRSLVDANTAGKPVSPCPE